MDELQKQLVKIQKELKAPKNQKNTFGNYNYRSCEDILEAVKPLLGDMILTLTDEIVNLGDRFYVKATATIESSEQFESVGAGALPKWSKSVSAFAREAQIKKGMDEAQITGSASSYARKYALNGLFAIDDTKDADTQDNTKSENKKPDIKKASSLQVNAIKEILKIKGKTEEKILETLKVSKLEDISEKQAEGIINKLNQ